MSFLIIVVFGLVIVYLLNYVRQLQIKLDNKIAEQKFVNKINKIQFDILLERLNKLKGKDNG